MSGTVLLIDGSALVFRSYYAFLRSPLRTSRGEETSAVFGTVTTLLRVLKEREPEYAVFVLDSGKPTFRHEMYDQYKANRPETPESLKEQFPRVREVVKALSIPVLLQDGYEADDLIGTLAFQAAESGVEACIYSGDKDFLQLVRPGIKIIAPGRDEDTITGNDADVEERIGVPARKVIDLLALAGDSSDNVPGVPGVGPKTAVRLIREHGSLEGIYENVGKLKGKLAENLRNHKAKALLSRDLVTICTDAPIEFDPHELARRPLDPERVAHLFQELEFHRLLDEIGSPPEEEKREYTIVRNERELRSLARLLGKNRRFAFDTETTSTDPIQAALVGISLAVKPGQAWYIPIDHQGEENIPIETARKILGPVFRDQEVKKIAQNAKYDLIVVENAGFEVEGLAFDPMIASYLLDPGQRSHGLDRLVLVHLNHKMTPISEIIGTGRSQKTMDHLYAEEVVEYACEDADYTLRLAGIFEPKLKESSAEDLYHNVEMPLVHVLKRMETAGVSLDLPFLNRMSRDLKKEIDGMESKIHQVAGGLFNVNSPIQLQKVLFEEIGLKPRKKTKTGFSTDNDVLQELAREHPLPGLVLEYRQLEKLRGTYVDALPKLINSKTGKIHTSFNQTVAATGRLSSSDPGLQNIPIRAEVGRKIRKAFLPGGPDRRILSLDYSQVELRLLAHLSEDETMIEDFRSGTDIHRRTAATLFGVKEHEVSGEMRSRAKAVNFGIVYGMGAFGLASRLDIGRAEAQAFIEEYFRAHPGVKGFLERTVEEGREKGYVETMLHRRRYLPDLSSKNGRIRSFAERTAVNTPIQGSAADLIKLAMIAIDKALMKKRLHTRMILQVHDELVFDAPTSELEEVSALAKELMENQMDLKVPLVVDSGHGENWLEAHGLEGAS